MNKGIIIGLTITFVTCGCGVIQRMQSHYEIDLVDIVDYRLPRSSERCRQKIVIDSVTDKRHFSGDKDASPGVPSVGCGFLRMALEDSPQIRSSLIGRREIGNIVAKNDVTVAEYFRKQIEEALMRADFELISNDCADSYTWHLKADIEQFWTSPRGKVNEYSDATTFQTRTKLSIDITIGALTEPVHLCHTSRDTALSDYGAIWFGPEYKGVFARNADSVVDDLYVKFKQLRRETIRNRSNKEK